MSALFEILALPFGIFCFVAIAWACVRAGMLKAKVDRSEDREQSDRDVRDIVDSTRGNLIDTHPHMRAGSAWGREL